MLHTFRLDLVEIVGSDREAMLPLPPAVFDLAWRSQTQLSKDYYVRVAPSDQSVSLQAIGRIVEVSADLEPVKVRCGGKPVVDHQRSLPSI